LYRELVRLSRLGRADFSRTTTFNLDEFRGVSSDHPGSYRRFMQRHLFDFVAPRHVGFLDGAARDVRRECDRYEREIAAAGGIDLQILGLGTNGHIGFNEPASSLVGPTHEVRLTAATRRANQPLFPGESVPRSALSMGIATILAAKRIVLMATGRSKARAVRAMAEGRITPRVPASILQVHPAAEIWLDRAAASALSRL
jgi:glucosamine-6-phosphate deaminase